MQILFIIGESFIFFNFDSKSNLGLWILEEEECIDLTSQGQYQVSYSQLYTEQSLWLLFSLAAPQEFFCCFVLKPIVTFYIVDRSTGH